MNRTGAAIVGFFVVSIFLVLPKSSSADWKVYYTGKAASMFGSYGRGNFASKGQCESYQMTRPAFERNNSYCSGFDIAPPSPAKKNPQPGQGKPGQGQAVKQPQQGQADARENQFAKDRESLLRTIKMPPPDEGLQPGGTSFFGSGRGNGSPEVRAEQEEFEKMNDRWVAKQRQLIDQRLREPNRYAAEIYKSLKRKAPPPLPARRFDELKPGDVLLISREGITDVSFWINLGDRVTTDLKSPASHTVLFLKEVNGRKLFLDHTPARGSHVIDEDEFMRTYGDRDALVASPRIAVAQPVRELETARIWEAAKQLARKEADVRKGKSGNIADQTGYGIYGDENMVCSEASRWVLVRSGRDIPESASPLKRLLGIHYGPANFFSDEYNFIITPLWGIQ